MSTSNRKVYIVAGGPSLKDFPFSVLKHLTTIAVNHAFVDVPNPNYFITCDSGVTRSMDQTSFLHKKKNTHCVEIIGVPDRVKGFLSKFDQVIYPTVKEGLSFSFDDFRTGANSGYCALQYAVILGYKLIYLLGFDLSNIGGFHYYDNSGVDRYDEFYGYFVEALKFLKEQTDIKVISCSSISRLNKIIPFQPVSEVFGL